MLVVSCRLLAWSDHLLLDVDLGLRGHVLQLLDLRFELGDGLFKSRKATAMKCLPQLQMLREVTGGAPRCKVYEEPRVTKRQRARTAWQTHNDQGRPSCKQLAAIPSGAT